MEGLIIFLIITAISSLFNREKKKEDGTTGPVVPQRPRPTGDNSSTDDAQEEIQDLSRQLFERMKRQEEPVVPPVEQKTPLQLAYEERVRLEREERKSAQTVIEEARRQKREWEREGLAVYDDVWTKKEKELKQEDLLPKTEKDLLKGVIFAEIMSRPKSLRKK